MKRRVAWIFTLVIFAGMFVACRATLPKEINDSAGTEQEPAGDVSGGLDEEGFSVEFTDEEGFVTIKVKDGDAGIHFNAYKWEESWDTMDEFFDSAGITYLQEETFPITGLPSKVVDVFVGQIPGMNSHTFIPFNIPSIILLLDDGSVAHIPADPLLPVFNAEYEYVPLIGLKDIVSISYESSGEGMGDSTVYAADNDGRRYDIQIPWKLRYLTEGRWICNLSYDEEGTPTVCGYLGFSSDDTMEWYVGWPESDIAIAYEGTYQLILAEGQESRPSTIVFDLRLSYTYEGESNNESLKGMCFAEASDQGEICLSLFPSNGDHLYSEQLDVYEFYLENAYSG